MTRWFAHLTWYWCSGAVPPPTHHLSFTISVATHDMVEQDEKIESYGRTVDQTEKIHGVVKKTGVRKMDAKTIVIVRDKLLHLVFLKPFLNVIIPKFRF